MRGFEDRGVVDSELDAQKSIEVPGPAFFGRLISVAILSLLGLSVAATAARADLWGIPGTNTYQVSVDSAASQRAGAHPRLKIQISGISEDLSGIRFKLPEGMADSNLGTPACSRAQFDEKRFTYVKALDTDEDGRADNLDNCPTYANGNQSNLDGDGYGDSCDTDIDGDQVLDGRDNCPRAANRDQRDTNQNGKGDVCEDDRDNDGVPDSLDAFPDDPFEHSDGDRDRVGDFHDNCPNVANHDQRDSNANSVGDVCDPTQPPQSVKSQISKDTTPPQLKLRFKTRRKRLLVNGQAIDRGGPSVSNVLLNLNPICKKKTKRMKRTSCRNVTKKLQPDDRGRFKLSLRLTGIRHRLSISATDKAGNKATKKYMVKKIFVKSRKKSHQTKLQIHIIGIIEVAYKSRRDR